eukprot:NODE_5858_length_902_cov_7.430039_g5631_i0.p1 GENE.NODE_5858_length_902_cov_7.430039_g5631_i0~~NODE_5858_length_902_cov_7.430039_g5631_i0.p1  ORF type:complete len:270 (+),score=35.87 NODE_5858_length_902_cov_7.430039_g5631_i0:59-811(+)
MTSDMEFPAEVPRTHSLPTRGGLSTRFDRMVSPPRMWGADTKGPAPPRTPSVAMSPNLTMSPPGSSMQMHAPTPDFTPHRSETSTSATYTTHRESPLLPPSPVDVGILDVFRKISLQMNTMMEKMDRLESAVHTLEAKQDKLAQAFDETCCRGALCKLKTDTHGVPLPGQPEPEDQHFIHTQRHVHHFHTVHVVGSAEETVDLSTAPLVPTTKVICSSPQPDGSIDPIAISSASPWKPHPDAKGTWVIEP